MTARLVHFTGMVQGVGFRYTAISIARNYNVTGYVRNLPDGRVEMLVEGREDETTEFIDRIRHEMAGYIRDVKIQDVPVSGNYKRFTLRY